MTKGSDRAKMIGDERRSGALLEGRGQKAKSLLTLEKGRLSKGMPKKRAKLDQGQVTIRLKAEKGKRREN